MIALMLAAAMAAGTMPPIASERELVQQLAVQGVRFSDVNWLEVNALCGPASGNKVVFYQCRLANGVKQAGHMQAKRSCSRKADNLLIRRNRSRYDYAQSGSRAAASGSSTDQFRLPPTRVRKQYVEDCMEDFGYPDSENWRVGQ